MLAGLTVGFISNGKEGTKGFFGHPDIVLRDEFGVVDVVWRTRSNFSAPADDAITAAVADWDAVVTRIGDWGSCSSCSSHDAVLAECRGVAALAVMTACFVSAADLMARVLGMSGCRYAVVDHPVSRAGEAGRKLRAAVAAAAVRELLVRR